MIRSRSRPILALLALSIAFIALAPLSGCTGKTVRDNALSPTLTLGSSGLESDVSAGIAALPADQQSAEIMIATQFFDALRSNNRSLILTNAIPVWPRIVELANSGIDAKVASGEIKENGAESLRERVRSFDLGLAKVIQRLTQDQLDE